jgi:hypothetical protein
MAGLHVAMIVAAVVAGIGAVLALVVRSAENGQ